MQNRTELVGAGITDRLLQLLRNYWELLEYLAVAALSFVMAGSYIFVGISPFGVAFTASVKSKYSLPAVLGSVVGYALSPVMSTNMKYIGAVLLVGMARWVLFSGKLVRPSIWLAPAAAGGALALTSLAVTFATGAYIYTLALSLSEVLLATGSAYFFVRAAQTVELGVENADRNDVICLIVSFCIGIIALARLTVFGLSVGRIAAVVIVLICALGAGEGGGAVSGVGAGATAGMLGQNFGFLMGSYSLGGLAAGIFSGTGRLGAASAFVITNAVVSILAPSRELMMGSIYEAFAASVIFMLLPRRALNLGNLVQLRGSGGARDDLVQHLLFTRLHLVADGLTDICQTTRQVSQKLDTMASSDISSVYSNLAEGVCKRCGYRSRCWQLDYNKTMDALNSAMLVLKKEQTIEKGQLPEHFSRSCCRLDSFVTALNHEYGEYLRSQGTRRKVSQIRNVVTDQFEGMSLMIEELSSELGHITTQDYKLSAKALEYLKSEGLEPLYACCYLDDNDRMTVEGVINPFKLARVDQTKTALDLSDICERQFGLPTVQTFEKKTVLTFTEKANYVLEYGAAQIIEEGSRITGDSYRTLNDRRGNSVAILSDGMGSGGNAAVDSAMTTDLLARPIQAGVSFDAALKMVNSALLVKSGEESLATVDVAAVDLYTGRASFYKAGAAPTFVVKNGHVGYVESNSLPAGILRGVAFEKSAMTFREGDMVLLVSDGVTSTGVDWIPSQIEANKNASPQVLAQNLARTAKERHVQGRDDDITVVVARFCKGA